MSLSDLGRTEVERLIDEWIIGFDAENRRRMLKRRLLDGITYERLAEEFDKSPRQTRAIVQKCEEILFKHIPGLK